MWNLNLQAEYDKLLPLLEKSAIEIDRDELRKLFLKKYPLAEEHFSNVRIPRIIKSRRLYRKQYLKTVLNHYIASKNVKKIHLDNPPADMKWSILLTTTIDNFTNEKEIGDVERDYTQLHNIEQIFIQATNERNLYVKHQGYQSRIEWALDKYQIPKKEYMRFVRDVDRAIIYYNQLLSDYSVKPTFNSVNGRCYVCQLKSFPFKTLKEAYSEIVRKYPIVEQYRDKITIDYGDISQMQYRNDTDDFLITINKKKKTRHQILDLVHEFTHILNAIEDYQHDIDYFGKTVYFREKSAIERESLIIKEVSPILEVALIIEILNTFTSTLFQIKVFEQPNQDLNRLYAELNNRCFVGLNQVDNPLWIHDEIITFTPLSNLPHAVAHANLLLTKL